MTKRRKDEGEGRNHDPKVLPHKREMVPVADLQSDPEALARRPVPLGDRQGVFVHSFVCQRCYLHFNLYSWRLSRHRSDNITCPECGQKEGAFLHTRAILSEKEEMTEDGNEIWNHVPYPGGFFLSDSKPRG